MRAFLFILTIICTITSSAQEMRLVLPIGHTAPVTHASFSPDGRFILTGAKDGVLMLWEAATGKLLMEYKEHVDEVNSARFNTDGSQFITGSNDKTARIWETRTGRLLHTINDHESGVVSAQFAPNGKTILTASDRYIKIWDAVTLKMVDQIGAHSNSIIDALYSPDGKKFFTASWDRSARIWDAESRLLLHNLKEHSQWLSSMQVSPSGKFLVTTSLDSTAIIWDIETGKLLHRLRDHKEDVVFATFSPNDSLVVTASEDNMALVWDVATGKMIAELKGHQKDVSHAVFSPDAQSVFTVSKDGTGKLWNPYTGKLIATFKHHINELNKAAFSRDGRSIVTASSDWTGVVWDAASGQQRLHLRGFSEPTRGARYSPDGRSLLTVSANEVKIWDTKDGRPGSSLTQDEGYILVAELSADGKKMLTASTQHVYIWDLEKKVVIHKKKTNALPRSYSYSPDGNSFALIYADGVELFSITGEAARIVIPDPLGRPQPIASGQFSPDGSKFILASWDGVARVFNPGNGRLLGELRGHQRELLDAVFSPDGKYVFTFSLDGSAKLWDLSTGQPVTTVMHFYTGSIGLVGPSGQKVIFAPDGKKIALIRYTSVSVYDLNSGQLVSEMIGHTAEIVSASFSPDGKKMITSAKDNTAKLWDVSNGSRLANLKGHEGIINSASFSPDGNRMITGSNDHTARVWNAKGDLVYSFFTTDDDGYFLQLPSRHYLATRGAAKRLHYVTPELNTISFEQLDVQFNRPDRVLAGIGNPDTALINSYKRAYEKRVKKLGIDTSQADRQINLPQVQITNVSFEGFETKSSTVQIKISAKDAQSKLTQLQIWINDVPLFGMKGIQLGKRNIRSLDTTLRVKLSKGENHITASVINAAGTESYRMPLFVKYLAEPGNEKLYFFGIGINRFAEPGNDLSWSVKDIQDLAGKLKAIYGDRLIVDTLFDKNVTVKNIATWKSKLQSTTIDDKVILAYSGHGLLSDAYDYYLSTYDVSFDKPEKNGLPYEQLEQLLDGIPARQKLMLIDACHSGEVDKEEMSRYELKEKTLEDSGTKSSRKPVLQEGKLGMRNSFELMQELFVNVGRSTGATVISAAAGTQLAQEHGALENGVFTFTILEFMRLRPSATVSQLKEYVNKRVPELTNGLQVPTTRSETKAVDWRVW